MIYDFKTQLDKGQKAEQLIDALLEANFASSGPPVNSNGKALTASSPTGRPDNCGELSTRRICGLRARAMLSWRLSRWIRS